MMDAMNRLIDPSAVGAGGTLDDLQKNTKRLAEAVQSINANARSGQPERLGESVKQATQFVSKIIDASKAICAGTDRYGRSLHSNTSLSIYLSIFSRPLT
jgi:hypothetical protein